MFAWVAFHLTPYGLAEAEAWHIDPEAWPI